MKKVVFLLVVLVCSTILFAAEPGVVTGTVTDALGAVIQNAELQLLENGKSVQTTKTDTFGKFRFTTGHPGRFQVLARASSFRPAFSQEFFATPTRSVEINLTLLPPLISEHIVVSATATPIPEARTGASISVIDALDLATARNLEQALRFETGVQAYQLGPVGGAAAVRVRGGTSASNKVLIDGVPANNIGGDVDFGYLISPGYENVELFRGPNSALFGSDALASVINVTTRHGATPLPELKYSIDGGNFGTYSQQGSLGGAWKRFDYFTHLTRFDTANSEPNSQFHTTSVLGNFGWQLAPNTSLRTTVRRSVAAYNEPNSILFYGTPDNSSVRHADLAFGVTLDHRPTERSHILVRYGGLRLRSNTAQFAVDGQPFDPFALYLGQPVTIRGANGYQASGQALFFHTGFSSALANRDFAYAQTDYRFSDKLTALFAFRYEDENGFTASPFSRNSAARGNYSYILQANGGLWSRLYYTLGTSIENNAVFGNAVTPRASLAFHVVRPKSEGVLSGTRWNFNFGKGIKEPDIFTETNSLYRLLQEVPDGQALIAKFGIRPFRAERSRNYDGGIEQRLFGGKARVAFTYFHNQFSQLGEFVSTAGLVSLGVPLDVAQASGFGAFVNTLAYRAQGTELELEYHFPQNVALRGGWTFMDAVVQRSFSSDAMQPSINPLFPAIPIGAFSPLIGARPFRVAPNTGFAAVEWRSSRWFASFKASFVSRRDDSTFLSDANFGNTLLLPNRDLAPGYQKLDLYGSYNLTRLVSLHTAMENLLNQHYQQVFGYPAMPFTVRAGMTFRFGGESWKLN
jgi:vitamin B12 transporter